MFKQFRKKTKTLNIRMPSPKCKGFDKLLTSGGKQMLQPLQEQKVVLLPVRKIQNYQNRAVALRGIEKAGDLLIIS